MKRQKQEVSLGVETIEKLGTTHSGIHRLTVSVPAKN